jgi:low affinity Fe/Cu permease
MLNLEPSVYLSALAILLSLVMPFLRSTTADSSAIKVMQAEIVRLDRDRNEMLRIIHSVQGKIDKIYDIIYHQQRGHENTGRNE